MPSEVHIDFVLPVYNEGPNIERTIRGLFAAVPLEKRILIVYDFDEDNTLPAARRLMDEFPAIELVRNTRGRGVLNAMRSGIDASRGDIVIITMADLSDDLAVVPRMTELIRNEGYDLVCASRYMRGGRQIGGPLLKRTLSRLAGLSLHWLAGLPVHDATNSFRAYRGDVLRAMDIQSTAGFDLSLELLVKAHAAGRRVTEVPSTWRDRTGGESRFRLWKWMPHYLRWWGYAVVRRGSASKKRPASLA